jgi:Fe-S oxidoreductase
MSNGIKLDKRLYNFTTRCVRCAECTFGYKNAEFELFCPIYNKFNFFTYSLGGIAQLARALHEGRINLTESVMDIVYHCTNCGACAEVCAEVDFPDMMELQHEVRARCVEAGQVPFAHMAVIEGLKKDDNMMQKPKAERGKWAEGLEVKDVTKEKAEVYYHAGCRYCFDEELWPAARSAVNLLKKAGIDVGIAGKDETCCGGRAYELGYQGEFIKYAENNMEMLRTAGIKTVVTSCADGYYAFNVLYDKLGKKGDLEVFHITQYLDRLIKKGRLKLTKGVTLTVTYHDPCHLGRKVEPWLRQEGKPKAGEIYQPPRDLLNRIPNLRFIEMRRIMENAWCCGAGGGIIDAYPDFARWTAQERIEEAKATGAEVMVTACPWCKRNFADAIKEGNDGLKIYDIVELIEQAL